MANQSDPFAREEFWDDLLAFIEEGRVVPILGQELLTIEQGGKTLPLYRALADALLARYGLDSLPAETTASSSAGDAADNAVYLRPHQELNDAVCRVAASGRRIQDLYRPINDTLRALLRDQPVPPALHQLARIRQFDLFATTTFDDLLARALNEVRFGGEPQTDQIEYAPGLSSERVRDIPNMRASDYTGVFYALGKASASPSYVIHDEDALEFVHGLQAGRGNVPERLLSEIRSRNLLLIGCCLPEWVSRFFIRLSNSSRLSSGDRLKKEFMVDQEVAASQGLTLFFERFSQNTLLYGGNAGEFVVELGERWAKRNPVDAVEAGRLLELNAAGSQPSGSVFISYSSDDVAAARTLSESLGKIGGDVAWFDKSELRAGDNWERKILGAIQRCSLFLPLLSESTLRRSEGYFRREWDEASERSRMIQGRRFICPIVIDAEYDGNSSRYDLVPDRFRLCQYSHAPRGEMDEALMREFVTSLRGLRRARP